jgi:hypothetical protein
MRNLLLVAIAVLLIAPSASAEEPVGIFENHMDVGDIAPGEAAYNSDTGEYQVKGSDGTTDDMMTDYFHFVYSEVIGDFRIKAKTRAENLDGIYLTAGAGITVRDTPTAEALFYLAYVQTDLAAAAVWRSWPGFPFDFVYLPCDSEQEFEIVREGSSVSMYCIDSTTGEPTLVDSRIIEFTDPVCVGLLVRSWDPGRYTMGYFTDVELITESAVDDWQLYR